MHLIRRAAFRTASAPSSFLSSSRSINTSTPFVLRSKAQSAFTPSVFRRFNSDEASQGKSNVESADGESGSVRETIKSASESASTYVQDAAKSASETVSEGYEQAKEYASDAAAAVGGYSSRPRREYNRDSSSRPERRGGYGNDRGDRGGYGNDRGDRGGYGNDRGSSRGMDRGGDRFGANARPLVPTSSVYVGNLLFDVTASDLEREFGQFGSVKSSVIATDARGLSKGFGYVEYETIEQAAAAIEAKHQTILEGRRLVVNYMNKTQREGKENPPSKTLFIGNLAFEMSDADLNKLFRDIRNVIDVRVAIDRRTGQPRGFAHADFVDVDSAVKGKETLTGKEVYGRTLRVDYSTGSREGRGDGGAPREGGSRF